MSYRRDIFEKGFTKVKQEIYAETNNYHTDTYTGLPLIPGGIWDFEHIISAKEFSDLDNIDKLDYETQSAILNHRYNIGFTERTINKSKSKHDLITWLNKNSNGRTINNAKFYKIDFVEAKKLRERILTFLKSEINKNCAE